MTDFTDHPTGHPDTDAVHFGESEHILVCSEQVHIDGSDEISIDIGR